MSPVAATPPSSSDWRRGCGELRRRLCFHKSFSVHEIHTYVVTSILSFPFFSFFSFYKSVTNGNHNSITTDSYNVGNHMQLDGIVIKIIRNNTAHIEKTWEKKTLLCNHFLEKGHLTSLCCGKRCDSEMLKYHWQLEITSNYYHKVCFFLHNTMGLVFRVLSVQLMVHGMSLSL